MKLRVLQTSDLHLGGPVLHSGHGFGEHIFKERIKEADQVLAKICSIIKDENIELVLLPGDLWDRESVSLSVVKNVMDAFGSITPVPVIIVPGNHDFMGPDSYYHEEVAERYGLTWPDNVTIVRSRTFSTFTLPQLPDVSFTAMATASYANDENRYLQGTLPKGSTQITILLFHGSRMPGKNVPDSFSKNQTMPFVDEELLQQGFTYTSLGHYHRYQWIQDADGKSVAAYAGDPFAREFRDGGEKGVLFFELDESGVDENTIRHIPVDTRRYIRITPNVTGANDEKNAIEIIKKAIQQAGSTEADLVRVHLKGRFGKGAFWKPELDTESLAYALEMISIDLLPEFDLETAMKEAPPGGALAAFLMQMRTKLEEARQHTPQNPSEIKTIEIALQMGYDAFQGEATVIHAEPLSME